MIYVLKILYHIRLKNGYFTVNALPSVSLEKFKPYIKDIAKEYHSTYRSIETQLAAHLDEMQELTLAFIFTNETNIKGMMFSEKTKRIITTINCTVGIDNGMRDKQISFEKEDIFEDIMKDTKIAADSIHEGIIFNTLMGEIAYQMVCLLVTSLWYMATTSPSTKYIYEEKHPVVTHRHKRKVHVSDTKFIATPVYDFSKIKTTTVQRLVTRKKGWTYSHSFQVHGHYRHYKNGKVIFIESYIKGKGKPFKAQTTVLTPEKIKEE